MIPELKHGSEYRGDIEGFAKSLTKGDYLTPDQISKVIAEDPESQRWPLQLMNLRQCLMRLRPDLQMKFEKGGLRVLLDREAGNYNTSEILRHVRGIRRQTNLMMTRIDTSNLTTDEQRKLDQQRHVANCLTMGVSDSIRQAKRLEQVVYPR